MSSHKSPDAAADEPRARGQTRRFPQVPDFVGRKGGAGDRGRTGDVQLGKGTEPEKDEETD
jgi:hypothetical protein